MINKEFHRLYNADMKRYNGSGGNVHRFHFWLRLASTTNNKFVKLLARFVIHRWRDKYGLEIMYTTKIGPGLCLCHPYNITVNSYSVLGSNISLYKGCTIGQENRGKRKGSPIIGNKVWVGTNAQVIGNITIGDDVLIAPNSFVNCDVPSHSVVYGNPCVIKQRDRATESYIYNCFEE